MKEIAFFALTPLGDSIAQMGQLEEIHRLYAPCRVTVFAIPLIAELYKNYRYCDEAVALIGGIHGPVSFKEIPRKHFDVVFNHGYDESWTEMLRQMDYGEAYGMEEKTRPPEVCDEIFKRWVSLKYWREHTLVDYQYVSEQMAEVIRLVNPEFRNGVPHLNEENYRCTRPANFPSGRYALFLPGTSALMKYWPIGKYLQLARLMESGGYEAYFVIGPQDMRLKDTLKTSGLRFADNLSLSELAYVCAHASIVFGNDSGPMHMVACFDAPSVHFYTHTGAHNWFQYDQRRHKLVMADCGRRNGIKCGDCLKTCIGKITLRQAYDAARSLLPELPEIAFRQIGLFIQDLIGDALVNICQLEHLSDHFLPCEITVFATKTNASLFGGHAFCDKVVEYTPGKWHHDELPSDNFEAIFNNRYDLDSVEMIRCLTHGRAYGYENCEISEAVCREVYSKWLPLTMWDDEELRWHTSVSEQGMCLVRLVEPKAHCECISLAEK